MLNWTRSVRHSFRQICRTPRFSLVVALTIGLGIAVNTAIFSLIDSTFLRPLPFDDSDELVFILSQHREMGFSISPHVRDLEIWQNNLTSFDYLEGYSTSSYDLTGEGEPVQIGGAKVTAGLFNCLRVNPIRGRAFTPDDAIGRHGQVILIGEHLWKRRFGGASDIVGQPLLLDGEEHLIIGVLPSWCRFPNDDTEIWVPTDLRTEMAADDSATLSVIARLKTEVSVEWAEGELAAIAEDPNQVSESAAEWTPKILRSTEFSDRFGTAFTILMIAAGFVLLSACANVAGMLLARGQSRQREMAIRITMGATRFRLLGMNMVENLVLASLGGVVGLFMAVWLTDFFTALTPTGFFMPVKEIRVDMRILACVGALVALTTLLFGAAPSIQAVRTSLMQALKLGSSGSGLTKASNRTRQSLLVVQMTICFVLVISAGLLARSFMRMLATPSGFQSDSLVAMKLDLSDQRYPSETLKLQYFEALIELMQGRPEFNAVSVSDGIPLDNMMLVGLPPIDGLEASDGDSHAMISSTRIDEHYFDIFGISLIEGRRFTRQEIVGGNRVLVISESLARRGWPGASAIGGQMEFNESYTVIGVVNDIREKGPHVEHENLQMYFPLGSEIMLSMTSLWAVARTNGDASHLIETAKQQVWSLDPDQPVAMAAPMNELYLENVAQPRFTMILVSLIAAVATFLMAIGIFAATAYAVARQTREIGIRAALGARADQLVGAVVRKGLFTAMIGIVVGGVISIGLSSVMSHLLFGIAPVDVVTYGLTAAFLLAITSLACYVPARRAARIDPMVALRNE